MEGSCFGRLAQPSSGGHAYGRLTLPFKQPRARRLCLARLSPALTIYVRECRHVRYKGSRMLLLAVAHDSRQGTCLLELLEFLL